MLGILPYAGVDITIFELLKERLLDQVRSRTRGEMACPARAARAGCGGSLRAATGWAGQRLRAPKAPCCMAGAPEPAAAEAAEGVRSACRLLAHPLLPLPPLAWLQYEGSNPPAHMILAAGMCSSSIAQFAAYPLALTRTRLQVGRPCTVADDVPRLRRSSCACVLA